MRRMMMLVLVIALLCGCLSGCGESQDSVPAPAQIPVRETEAQTYLVHAYVPESWGPAYIWAWSDTEGDVSDTWPGEKMVPDGEGWYTYEVPMWADNVCINDRTGELQSGGILVEPKEAWIGVCEDGTVYLDYVPYEMPQDGYIEELEGEWESVFLEDRNSNINANALIFPETVTDVYEMTIHMEAEMLAGTKCKDWQVWIRSNGTFVKLVNMYLEAGDGYTYETFTFDTPISFDGICITATASGGYSYYMGIAVTDVWYYH